MGFVFTMFWWIIFSLRPIVLFLWRQELSCQSQFGSFTEDLEREWLVPGRSRAHCIYYWFVPRHDLALHFCMFFSPFTVTSSCSSDFETHKNHFNPRPTSSLSLWSRVWWHLFSFLAFSSLFFCRFFLYIHIPNPTLMELSFPSVFQYNSWRSCEKCDALLPPILPARQPCDCSSGSERVPMALGNTRGILV